MVALRHLEFAKIATLDKWPIYAFDSSSPFRNLHKLAIMALRYCQKRFSIWRPSAILNLKNIDFFVKFPCLELKFVSVYKIWSKLVNSRLRYGDKAIFKMAAIRHLEFVKIAVLLTWPISACDPHLCSKFRVDRPIWRWDIDKNDFQYGVRPPSWICIISILC